MRFTKFTAALLCATALAACDTVPKASQNPDDFRVGAGDASDPASVAYFQQTVGDRVLFVVDQASLTNSAIATLNAQANWLLEYTDKTVTIEGHADEQGTREYNLALGARRASAVRDHLVSRGVADNRVKTVTFGKERPIEICSDETCWSKNRRAVTVVAGGLTS
ncbi:MAG: peptidoglycan-associated lipoprotein Pal [Rhodobacteraceae bacterium]|nr:peptidoglycan-associated lipoprotein Pal [Paracoccaceae bacterium]